MPLYSVRVQAPAEVWEVVRAPDEKHARAKALAQARHPHTLSGDDWRVRHNEAVVMAIKEEEPDNDAWEAARGMLPEPGELPEEAQRRSRDEGRLADQAELDAENRLTVNHVTAGRIAGTEHTLCGLTVPRDAEPAPDDAPWCKTCQERDV